MNLYSEPRQNDNDYKFADDIGTATFSMSVLLPADLKTITRLLNINTIKDWFTFS